MWRRLLNWLGSKWFSSNRYDASDKLKMTPSPTLSEKMYFYRKPGSEIRKALFEIRPATGSLVPRLDILVLIYVLPMPIDFTAYKTKLYYFKL